MSHLIFAARHEWAATAAHDPPLARVVVSTASSSDGREARSRETAYPAGTQSPLGTERSEDAQSTRQAITNRRNHMDLRAQVVSNTSKLQGLVGFTSSPPIGQEHRLQSSHGLYRKLPSSTSATEALEPKVVASNLYVFIRVVNSSFCAFACGVGGRRVSARVHSATKSPKGRRRQASTAMMAPGGWPVPKA